MIDRTNKLLLFLIALGLWANVALALRPLSLEAQTSPEALGWLASINSKLVQIADGKCSNAKLC